MNRKLTGLAIVFALVLGAIGTPASAQQGNASTNGGPAKTDSRILYHNGRVLLGAQTIYVVWYGNWASDINRQIILANFISDLGSSTYFQINNGYPNSAGQAPNGALTYGGAANDAYSHGATLTEADVADVVAQLILTGGATGLPFDASAIYVVLTSPDVTLEDGATHFCLTCCDLHGDSVVAGSPFRWVFVGHPARCPGSCGSQPSGVHTANGDMAADAMVSWLAHALNAVVTNPENDGWFDRYGLENSEKCEGTYGTTYPVTNLWGESALANVQFGSRHYLLQQNWVNGKKGHCSTSYLK
jgi:hypothetical protein